MKVIDYYPCRSYHLAYSVLLTQSWIAVLTVTKEELPLVQLWDSPSGKLIWQDTKVDDLSKDAKIVDALLLSTGDVAILTSSGSVVIRTLSGGQHWRWVPELA